MKKLIVLILAALLAIPSTAQIYRQMEGNRYSRYSRDGRAQYYGLRLGLNLASISSNDIDLDADAYAGLYLGGVYGVQLSYRAPVWFEVGFGYSEKGGITRIGYEGTNYRVKYRMGYLEVPLTVKYSIDVDEFHIMPFLGGNLSLGVTGKTKDYHPPRSSYSTYDTFQRFDGGLRIGCGAEYQMLYLELGFDFGLANINKDDFDTAHTRCLFVNAGVNF